MVAAAMPMDFLLDPLSGRVQSVCGELDDMERVHDRDRIRDRLSGRGLEPSKAVHRHDLDSLTEVLGLLIEPSPEHCLGAPGNHREQPGRTAAIADRCEVDDDRDVLVAQPSVAPDMLINTQDFDPVQTARMLNEQLLPGVEDRGVRGVPSDPERRRYPRDREPIHHQCFQPPADRGTSHLGSRPSSQLQVVTPTATTPATAIPGQANQQHRGAPTQRNMRQPTVHDPMPNTPTSAAMAPTVVANRDTLNYSTTSLETEPDRLQAEVGQAEEGSQIRTTEGSVEHIEALGMDGVGTSIIEGLDPCLQPHHPPFTGMSLLCSDEEKRKLCPFSHEYRKCHHDLVRIIVLIVEVIVLVRRVVSS